MSESAASRRMAESRLITADADILGCAGGRFVESRRRRRTEPSRKATVLPGCADARGQEHVLQADLPASLGACILRQQHWRAFAAMRRDPAWAHGPEWCTIGAGSRRARVCPDTDTAINQRHLCLRVPTLVDDNDVRDHITIAGSEFLVCRMFVRFRMCIERTRLFPYVLVYWDKEFLFAQMFLSICTMHCDSLHNVPFRMYCVSRQLFAQCSFPCPLCSGTSFLFAMLLSVGAHRVLFCLDHVIP